MSLLRIRFELEQVLLVLTVSAWTQEVRAPTDFIVQFVRIDKETKLISKGGFENTEEILLYFYGLSESVYSHLGLVTLCSALQLGDRIWCGTETVWKLPMCNVAAPLRDTWHSLPLFPGLHMLNNCHHGI